jgi:hypothetical protein
MQIVINSLAGFGNKLTSLPVTEKLRMLAKKKGATKSDWVS